MANRFSFYASPHHHFFPGSSPFLLVVQSTESRFSATQHGNPIVRCNLLLDPNIQTSRYIAQLVLLPMI